MAIVRNILSVVGGVVIGGVSIALVEALGHAVLSGEAIFAGAAIGYGLGATAGTYVASRFGNRVCAALVTALFAVLATINLFSFPHPVWFAPVAVVALLLGWFVGDRIAGARFNVGSTDR